MKMFIRAIGLLIAITMLFSAVPPQVLPALASNTALACEGEGAPTIIARTPLNARISDGSVVDCMIIVDCSGSDLNEPTALKDGSPMQWPVHGVFNDNGVYTIAVTNKSGASATLTFTIAHSDMKLTVTDSLGGAVACGAVVAGDVTVAYSGTDVNPPVLKKNNECISLPSDGKLTANGLYVVTLTNKTGGVIVFYFTIKKPSDIVISAVTATGVPVANNGRTTSTVTVTIAGTDLNDPTVKLNCTPIDWPEGGKFTAIGTYHIAVANTSGSRSEFTFTIFREGIKIWAKTVDGESVKDDGVVEADVTVYYSGTDLDDPSVTRDGSDIDWPEGGKFTENGTYLVTITDASGDGKDFCFTISKPDVLIIAKNPAGKEICDGKVVDCFVTVTYTGVGTLTVAVTQDDVTVSWPSGGKFTDNGKYVITLSNDAGASTDFSFTINRCDGVVAAKSESNKKIYNGGYSNKNVKVTISNGKTVDGVTLNGKTIRYPAKGLFKLQGKYVLTVKDDTATVTFTFTIDKSAPVILARAGRLVKEGQQVRSNVTVTVTDANLQSVKVLRNNVEITMPANKVFSKNGKYTIIALDKAGNKRTVHFTIKK